jgi:hypothetical protein
MICKIHYTYAVVFSCKVGRFTVTGYMGKCYLIVLYIKEHIVNF